MSLETKRNVLKRFGAPTTLALIERVEKHDDLWPSHQESFLAAILHRTIPSVFNQYLGNRWPTTRVKSLDYDGKLNFAIEVRYESWTLEANFGAATYYTDKTAFCVELDAFVCELSARFYDMLDAGLPWWNHQERRWSFGAPHRIGDRVYHGINTRLAEIKHRGGKYHWHLIPDKYRRCDWLVSEHKQGHANTLEEAKAVIEAAWKSDGKTIEEIRKEIDQKADERQKDEKGHKTVAVHVPNVHRGF